MALSITTTPGEEEDDEWGPDAESNWAEAANESSLASDSLSPFSSLSQAEEIWGLRTQGSRHMVDVLYRTLYRSCGVLERYRVGGLLPLNAKKLFWRKGVDLESLGKLDRTHYLPSLGTYTQPPMHSNARTRKKNKRESRKR